VRIAGRRKSTGSPLLYRTTTKFLEIFGLGGISDLPTISEIEDLRRNSEQQEKNDTVQVDAASGSEGQPENETE